MTTGGVPIKIIKKDTQKSQIERNLMERLKAYKFRFYPTEEQKIFFGKSFGCVRKVYNLMLDDRIKVYEETKNDSSKK